MKNKKTASKITLFILAAVLLASCQTKTPATDTTKPDIFNDPDNAVEDNVSQPITPAAVAIAPDNYNNLDNAIEGNVSKPIGMKWAPDSQSILLLSDSTGRILDAWTLETKSEFSFDGSKTWKVSPDGKTLALFTDEQTVQLIDTTSSKELRTIIPGYYLNNVDFSADGKSLLTSSYDDLRADIWNAESGKNQKTLTGFDTAAPVYRASFAEHSSHVIWNSRGRLQVSDAETGFISMPFDHEDWVTSWALSSDGKKLATSAARTVQGHFVPNILIWDTASGEIRMITNSEEPFEGLAFCPDTHIVAYAEQGVITVLDLDSFCTPEELPLGGRVMKMAFSPDGTALAAVNTSGKITVWRIPAD